MSCLVVLSCIVLYCRIRESHHPPLQHPSAALIMSYVFDNLMVGVGVVATFVWPIVWLLSNLQGDISDRFVQKCKARIKAYLEDPPGSEPKQPFIGKIVAGVIVIPILLIVVMFETAIKVIFATWWLLGIVSIAQVMSFRYYPLWPDTMRFLGVVAVVFLVGFGLVSSSRKKEREHKNKTRQKQGKETKARKLIRS